MACDSTPSACRLKDQTCFLQVSAVPSSLRLLRNGLDQGVVVVTSQRMKWFALALLCVVQFMVVLDIAIVNVALPSIQTDLHFTQENLQWVISAYALVFGGFLL